MSDVVIRKRILLVVAESDAAEALRFTLEDAGYEVLTTANVEEAIAKTSEQSCDVTVLDISLSELTRLDVEMKLTGESLSRSLFVLSDIQEEFVRYRFGDYNRFVNKKADLSELLSGLELLS